MRKFIFSIGLVIVSAFYIVLGSQNSVSVVSPAAVSATAPANASSAPTSSGSAAQTKSTAPTQSSAPVASAPAPTPAPAPAQTPTPTPAPAPAPAPAPTPKPTGQYTDGTYTGSQADAYYGTVQVEAIVQGGKLTDVQFLQYPNSHSTSVYINQQAMPYLTQEAVQAQSANVNIISGATFTSMAFQQSLASALAKAKI